MSANGSLKKMAEDKDNSAVQKITHYKVDPRILKVEPGFNIRIPGADLEEHIEEMKQAYKAGAIFPPLDIRGEGDDLYIVDGHCRTRMYIELIEEGVEIGKVEARQYTGNDADRVAHMLGTAQGKPLSTLEQGLCYLRLERFGWSRAEIIARSGKSGTHVDQALKLANSNSDVQQMVASGQVSARNAIVMLREHGEKAGAMLEPLVAEAKKKGKAKVTNASIVGRALPRKLVDRCASSLGDLFTAMPSEVRENLAKADDEQMVEVSAKYLRDLLEAHAEIQQLRGTNPDADPRQSSLLSDES